MSVSTNRELIDQAVAKATDTREVVIGGAALPRIGDVFARQFGDAPVVIVADERTFQIAGHTAQERLRRVSRAMLPPIMFPAQPILTPDVRHAQQIAAALAPTNAIPVAVGSGTINDLVKYAAHLANRSYLIVATAASMDGYSASGAALVDDGFKQTFACPAPRAVVADLDILIRAPQAMNASGYADLLGKVTAGADWLIADALGIEPILPDAWQMVHGTLRATLAEPERMRRNDPEAVERLFHGLVITGLAMQTAGSSRPASGSEHQFSHLWEMAGLRKGHDGTMVSHGHKVGLGSLAVAALYECLLDYDLAALDVDAACREWPSFQEIEQAIRATHDDPSTAKRALIESRAKYIPADQLQDRLHLLRSVWPELRDRLQDHLLPAGELARMLDAAGCPTTPSAIGLSLDRLRASYRAARQIRRRYTVLDLAAETGLFDECVDGLFRPGGFWGRSEE